MLGVLAILFFIGVPAGIIYLLVAQARLRARLEALESRLGITTAPALPEPESPATPEAVPEPAHALSEPPTAPPARFVFRADRAAQLAHWLKENWFLAVAALSLALAGVFLVQYGIETGILGPELRVLGAIALGAALIGAGEWLRRRREASDAGIIEMLPATFGGAGIVSIFAGIVAARQLYGLIGPESAFAALAATGALALLLGWFHGPFLSAVGILGAVAAPFLVGGTAEEPFWLYGYFALVVVVALGIDAARRWAWLSAFALIAGFGAATVLHLGAGGGVWFMAFAVLMVAASAAIPVWSITPAHRGSMVAPSLWRAGRSGSQVWPEFPTRLVAATVLAATVVAASVMHGDAGEFRAGFGGVGAIFAMLVLWLRGASALDDLAAIPVAGFVAMLLIAALWNVPGFAAFDGWVPPHAEAAPPLTASWLVAGGLAASAAAGWRSLRGGPHPLFWTCLAALTAPLAVIALEMFWRPAEILGAFGWALHALAAAALLTALAQRHANVEAGRDLRVSVFLIMGLTMISLALIIWFTLAALTVALAVMVLAAALLDARFGLAQLGIFVTLGVAVLVWRLVAVPGLGWAVEASLGAVLFAHGGVMAALAGARMAARRRGRARQEILLDSGIWIAGAVLASALIWRWVDGLDGTGTDTYWHVSLHGTVWLVTGLARLRRLPSGWIAALPLAVAGVSLLVWAAAMVLALTLLSPVWGYNPDPVLGPWLFDTLLIAYGVPAIVLLLAPRFTGLAGRWPKLAFRVAGAALAALWIAWEIRHVWRGPNLSVPGISDPEQYSYTVAMMLTSAALMLAAWLRRAPILRRLAVFAAAAMIAKVFAVDMSGLAGLLRVASFLALGLALAGLAQVNRWMTRAWQSDAKISGA